MQVTEYHQRIINYYRDTENAYKDSWDLKKSMAIHYGFWDQKVSTFSESLVRMNEVMAETAGIRKTDKVLDAGCGIGGSSIYLATHLDCFVQGITLSKRQQQQAILLATENEVNEKTSFAIMDYCDTTFPDESFDIVWACESACYAESKEQFIRESFRLLKPGGRLIVADGFVTQFENNEKPVIRNWLNGWQVNYLETPGRFTSYMESTGFKDIQYRNISREVKHSSRRLYKYYYLAGLYLFWKKLSFSKPPTDMQIKNIKACKYQHIGMKKGWWQYGLIVGKKP